MKIIIGSNYIDYWVNNEYIDYWVEDTYKIECDSTGDYDMNEDLNITI